MYTDCFGGLFPHSLHVVVRLIFAQVQACYSEYSKTRNFTMTMGRGTQTEDAHTVVACGIVRENVCNNSEKLKKACFLYLKKK